MQKYNNTNFLKDLIDSDFLFVRPSSYSRESNSKMRLNLGLSNNLEIANILDLNKSLKQLIRLIKDFTKTPAFSIFIWVEEHSTVELLNHLLKKKNSLVQIDIKTTPPSQKKNSKVPQFLLILGTPYGYYNSSIYYNFFQANIFLICKINSESDKNLFGCYKVFNDLSDIKKIIFLSVLINKAISEFSSSETIAVR